MKKYVALFSLLLTSIAAQTQSTAIYSDPSLAKEVHKINFRNQKHVPARVITALFVPQSKEVSYIHSDKLTTPKGSIQMKGIPASIISKGVARMQYERSER
jgi:hypothetical protein